MIKIKREKNKLAALKARRKKKIYLSFLEDKVLELKKQLEIKNEKIAAFQPKKKQKFDKKNIVNLFKYRFLFMAFLKSIRVSRMRMARRR